MLNFFDSWCGNILSDIVCSFKEGNKPSQIGIKYLYFIEGGFFF